MRVRFLRGTALGGVGNDAHPGDERELTAPQAQALIAAGRAVEVPTASSPLQQALDAVAQAQAAMVAPTTAAAPARRPRKGKDT